MAVQKLISLEPYPFHLASIWNPWVHWLPGQRASAAASSLWRARWCLWGMAVSWTRWQLGGERRLGRRNLWPPSYPGQTWLLCHLCHEKEKMLVKLQNWKLAAEKRGAKWGAWLRIQMQSKWLNFKGTRGAEIPGTRKLFHPVTKPNHSEVCGEGFQPPSRKMVMECVHLGKRERKKSSPGYLSELCHTAEIFHLLLWRFHSSCSHDKFSILQCWELLEADRQI